MCVHVHVHVGCNVTCHPACTDKLSNTCVSATNADMPPLTKRRRKGNDKQPKDHASSENERSDDAMVEHGPINVDLDESMDSEQPLAKKKQQKGDKGSPAVNKKSSKQQKSAKKTRKDGRVGEQGASGKDMTDTDLSDTNVPPPAKKQRKDKKGQSSETKQSKKSHTDVEDVRVSIKREQDLEDEDVASLLHFAPEGQLIKMDKVTSLW